MRVLQISALLLVCSAGALALAPARAEMDEHAGPQGRFEQMCSDQGKSEKFAEFRAALAQRIVEHLKLSDTQKAAFKDLQDARAKNRADFKAAICANKPDLSTFEKKLAFRESMMQRRLDAFKAMEPKLIAFYNTLDPWQKTEFEEMREHMMRHVWGHRGGEGWGHHQDEGGEGHGWSHHDQDDDE